MTTRAAGVSSRAVWLDALSHYVTVEDKQHVPLFFERERTSDTVDVRRSH